MKVIFSAGKARDRFQRMCREADKKLSPIEVTRIFKNGKEQVYMRSQRAISDGAETTGLNLISLFWKHHQLATTSLPDAMFEDDFDAEMLINSPGFSQYRRKVSDRTIRRHIVQLESIGFLKKTFRGTNAPYKLTLDLETIFGPENARLVTQKPEFLAENVSKTSDFLSQNPQNALPPQDTNCPHIHSLETNGNSTTNTMKVENSTEWKQSNENSTEWKQKNGNPSKQKPKNRAETHTVGNGNKGGGSGENVDKSVDNSVDKPVNRWVRSSTAGEDFNQQNRLVQREVKDFVNYALKSLWPEREFSLDEYERTLDLVMDSIFRPFLRLKPGEKQFEEWKHQLFKAVDVGSRYYVNHPDKFPGNPYTVHENWLGYFDQRNERGFNKVRQWQAVNKAKYHEQEGYRLIRTAIMHISKHQKGKAPKLLQAMRWKDVVNLYVEKMKLHKPEVQRIFQKRLKTLNFLQ